MGQRARSMASPPELGITMASSSQTMEAFSGPRQEAGARQDGVTRMNREGVDQKDFSSFLRLASE